VPPPLRSTPRLGSWVDTRCIAGSPPRQLVAPTSLPSLVTPRMPTHYGFIGISQVPWCFSTQALSDVATQRVAPPEEAPRAVLGIPQMFSGREVILFCASHMTWTAEKYAWATNGPRVCHQCFYRYLGHQLLNGNGPTPPPPGPLVQNSNRKI
jgi:hypothetical protein